MCSFGKDRPFSRNKKKYDPNNFFKVNENILPNAIFRAAVYQRRDSSFNIKRVFSYPGQIILNNSKQRMMTEQMITSLPISKGMVYNSYLKVIAKDRKAGLDKESIEQFHEDLSGNLNNIWNRMISENYFLQPVQTETIPGKKDHKKALSVLKVSDSIRQGVLKNYLEPSLENIFHSSSFGYRAGKSADNANKQFHYNCMKYAWIIDVHIKGLFDNINHDIMLQLLQQHTHEKWVMQYAERLLKVEMGYENGNVTERTKGIPKRGVISPLFANIYLHHGFDRWMDEVHTQNPFERCADNIVVHCSSKEGATLLLEKIEARMRKYALELHSKKTRIRYSKNYQCHDRCNNDSLTFLNYRSHLRTIKDIFRRKNRMAW